jgi:hypothetical protein
MHGVSGHVSDPDTKHTSDVSDAGDETKSSKADETESSKNTEKASNEKAAQEKTNTAYASNKLDAKELNKLKDNDANTKWVPYGGGQSEKAFNLPVKNAEAMNDPDRTTSKTDAATKDNPNTRGEKSYGEDRTKQGLRHMSAVVYGYLRHNGIEPQEVQMSLANGRLHISGNTEAANEKLRSKTKDKDGNPITSKDALKTMVDKKFRNIGRGALADRIGRHQAKVKNNLVGDEVHSRYKGLEGALGHPFQVPKALDKSRDGLHAERRLAEHLGDDFNGAAGIKRPCAACNAAIYDSKQRNGPSWSSRAATQDVDPRKIANTPPTSFSTPKGGGRPTDQIDTESDSEPESKSVSTKRKRED